MGVFGRVIMLMMPITPKFIIRWVANRYVAGPDLENALEVMRQISAQGACFTVDVLGEEITTLAEADFFVQEYARVLDAIVAEGLDANISLKPTAFGLLIDQSAAVENIESITRKAAENDIFVRLDMEDHRVTQPTIDLVTAMHERGLTNIGTVLQARLFRTGEDIASLSEKLANASDVRICKGIYLESEDIAHTGYHQIVEATNRAIDQLLDAGSYTAIASHDMPVINHSLAALSERGMGPFNNESGEEGSSLRKGKGPGYEFQMLLGVRGNIRRRLASEGHLTRVYIPYGSRWYEYSMRRLRENPDVAWHIAKSIIMPWTNRR
uniref:L-proline dehydrogenase n=1 Tax=uncultured marine group II/III euryarchaeote KM3_72_E02 TaxID=1456498 RepID=A0A075HJF1_9EURY|nr:L-proline dehydrogenase [uncultured marine group II/III euryarchaeote KM3_72_E02]